MEQPLVELDQLHASILGQTFFGVVWRDRLLFTVAFGIHARHFDANICLASPLSRFACLSVPETDAKQNF
jgi:hypothetical protein